MKQPQAIYPERPERDKAVQQKIRRVVVPKLQKQTAQKLPVLPKVPPAEMKKVKEEVAKEDAKVSFEQELKLKKLTNKSQHILYKCKSVFPFDLFPDEISIEPSQVNISVRTFFYTNHLLTIPVKNISDIHLQTTPFFASLKFIDRTFVENSFEIDYLKIHDAERVRKIVQGLIIASAEKIDVDKIDTQTLKEQAEQLGNMHQMED